MKTLKVEAVYLMAYETFEDVIADLFRFMDQIYNTRWLHSAPGYLSAMQIGAHHTGRRSNPAPDPVHPQGRTPMWPQYSTPFDTWSVVRAFFLGGPAAMS